MALTTADTDLDNNDLGNGLDKTDLDNGLAHDDLVLLRCDLALVVVRLESVTRQVDDQLFQSLWVSGQIDLLNAIAQN